MLKQFKIDWNTAKQKRRLLHPSKIVRGVVVFEQSVITFLGVDIHMSKHLVDGDEKKPPKDRRYTTVLEVPSTGKRIPITAPDWPTMAVNILSAITPGDDHERRAAQRMADIAHLANKRCAAGALERLKDTIYTDDEKAFIRDWLDNNIVRNRIDWNDDLLQMLIDNQNLVTGRFLIEIGVNLYEEADRYIPRVYDKVARLLLRVVTTSTGAELLPIGVVQREIFSELDPGTLGKVYNCVFQVNSLFKDICRRCGILSSGNWKTQELVFMVKFLGDFYARMTGMSVERRMHNVDIRKRRNVNSFNGGQLRAEKPLDTVSEETGYVPLVSGNDVFGDVLDKIRVADAKPSRKRKSKKPVDTVSDGLVGDLQDKIDNQAKAEAKRLRNKMKPVEEEDSPDETTAEETPAQEDESSFGSIGDAFAGLEIKE